MRRIIVIPFFDNWELFDTWGNYGGFAVFVNKADAQKEANRLNQIIG